MNVAGKSIIIIGDSHSAGGGLGAFGPTLKAELEAKGATVRLLAKGGTASANWLKPDKLAPVAGQTFDLAIIALGTNDAANANRAAGEYGRNLNSELSTAVTSIEKLADRLALDFIWVGPPPMGNKTKWYSQKVMDALYDKALPVFGQKAIDSRPLATSGMLGDGVHYGTSGAKAWAQKVAARFAGGSSEVAPQNSDHGGSSSAESAPSLMPIILLVAVGILFFGGRRARPFAR